jgi:hypothetical protein
MALCQKENNNMKHNRDLLEQIHARTFEGVDTLKELKVNSYAILELLVELDTLMGLLEKHYFLPLFHKDRDDNAFTYLYDELATFYVNHQNILNDHPNFTLVDNYYHVDFNEIISTIEQLIKEDLSTND